MMLTWLSLLLHVLVVPAVVFGTALHTLLLDVSPLANHVSIMLMAVYILEAWIGPSILAVGILLWLAWGGGTHAILQVELGGLVPWQVQRWWLDMQAEVHARYRTMQQSLSTSSSSFEEEEEEDRHPPPPAKDNK